MPMSMLRMRWVGFFPWLDVGGEVSGEVVGV